MNQLQDIVRTELEDERIGIHFNDPENRQSITESIETALSEYDCKLEVVFDLIEEGSVVVKEEILSNISEEIKVEEDFNLF